MNQEVSRPPDKEIFTMQNQQPVFDSLENTQRINFWICLQCGQEVIPLKASKKNYAVDGTFLCAAALAFSFVSFISGGLILTGHVIYKAWQMSHKYNCCPSCASEEVIPSNSPLARSYAAAHRRSI